MKVKSLHLFVYGSLMRRFDLPMHRLILNHGSFVDEGWMQGRLYLIAWYPGAVGSEDPDDRVYGEVFRIHAPEVLMPRLDAFEDCDPDSPNSGEYRRMVSPVHLLAGGQLPCHWYCFNRSVNESKRISSGRFERLEGVPSR
jgi:gamma-glutamylcyclotransferase (GGCT)/AIG2-like uncharacterized protein YtfP